MWTFNPVTPQLLTVPWSPSGYYVYVDVNGYIPVGSTGVILHCYNPHVDVRKIGLWEDPGFGNPFFDVNFSPYYHCWCIIGVDSNRRFKSRTNIQLWLVGYTGPDVAFLPSGVLKGTVFNAWETITCSEAPANATGLIFLSYNESGYELRGFGIQKHGSTDWRVQGVERGTCYGAIIGCDDQQRVDIYRGGSNDPFGWRQTYVKLIGYIKGMHFYTNAIDISLSETSVWRNVGLVGGPFRMPIIQVVSGAAYGYSALRTMGSTEETYGMLCTMSFTMVGTSPNRRVEGKISSTAVDFWLIGGDLWQHTSGNPVSSKLIEAGFI